MKNRTRQRMMLAVCMIWPILANPVIAGEPKCKVPGDCDDANDCTEDTCVEGMCVHTPVPDMTPCDDGDGCTYDDYCDYGVCYGYAQWCTDNNDCTTDFCDPASGCVNAPNNDDCDDGDACTAEDVCSGGYCGGDPIECPDGQVCENGECVSTCGNCPTDSSGDGNTGAPDLAQLLACWGPVLPGCECFDANGDGIIGPLDLATLLANWGPCP